MGVFWFLNGQIKVFSFGFLITDGKWFSIREGLPGVFGEQGNMSLFLGNRGTKLYKLEDENIESKFITRGTNTENVQEHPGGGTAIYGLYRYVPL